MTQDDISIFGTEKNTKIYWINYFRNRVKFTADPHISQETQFNPIKQIENIHQTGRHIILYAVKRGEFINFHEKEIIIEKL